MSPDHEPTPATIIGELLTSHPEAAEPAGRGQPLPGAGRMLRRLHPREVHHGPGRPARLRGAAAPARAAPPPPDPFRRGPAAAPGRERRADHAHPHRAQRLARRPGFGAARAGRHRSLAHRRLAGRARHPAAALGPGRPPSSAPPSCSNCCSSPCTASARSRAGPAAAPDHGSTVFGVLTGVFILVLTAGAAVLMAHMESPSLLAARQRWHRARAAYEEAAATTRPTPRPPPSPSRPGSAWSGPGSPRSRPATNASCTTPWPWPRFWWSAAAPSSHRPGNPAGPAAPVSGSGRRRPSQPETTAEGRRHEPRHLDQITACGPALRRRGGVPDGGAACRRRRPAVAMARRNSVTVVALRGAGLGATATEADQLVFGDAVLGEKTRRVVTTGSGSPGEPPGQLRPPEPSSRASTAPRRLRSPTS